MRRRRSATPSPWAENSQLRILVSLLGPVIDFRAGLPDEQLPTFFREYDKDVVARVTAKVSTPGFLLGLPAVPGAVEALREIGDARDDVALLGPASAAWRLCRADMYTWVERHLDERWAESLILARFRTRILAHRLLTSYAESRDWADPPWDVVVMDAPDNQDLRGVRMHGWDDVGGLVGDWLDRIPWQDGIWEIVDDSHFGISVRDRGDGTYKLHVFVEMYDESHSFDSEITDRYWDLGPAAKRPSRAGSILLDRTRSWLVDGTTEYLGRIEGHLFFEWGGRPWQ